MESKYKEEIENYVREKEKNNKEYFNLFHANFDNFQHSMLMGELESAYKELFALEIAELTDFFNWEQNGRTNKKR